MHPKIYLLQTHKVNFTNILPTLITNSLDLYHPCTYEIVDKFFKLIPGNFANDCESKIKTPIRDTDWRNNIHTLDHHLLNANGMPIIFGTRDQHQMNFLKEHYGDDILTIGINYNDGDYQSLLQNMAEYHVFMMEHDLIIKNEHDIKRLASLPKTELISLYQSEFTNLNLIPSSSSFAADRTININDLLNEDAVSALLSELSIPFPSPLYRRWLTTFSV